MNEGEEWCRIGESMATALLEGVPRDDELHDLAQFFRVFGDPTRLRILAVLAGSELCVHDLTRVLGMQQTAVSHQLKTLRYNRLVKSRREGRMVMYAIDDEHIDEITRIGLEHIRETKR